MAVCGPDIDNNGTDALTNDHLFLCRIRKLHRGTRASGVGAAVHGDNDIFVAIPCGHVGRRVRQVAHVNNGVIDVHPVRAIKSVSGMAPAIVRPTPIRPRAATGPVARTAPGTGTGTTSIPIGLCGPNSPFINGILSGRSLINRNNTNVMRRVAFSLSNNSLRCLRNRDVNVVPSNGSTGNGPRGLHLCSVTSAHRNSGVSSGAISLYIHRLRCGRPRSNRAICKMYSACLYGVRANTRIGVANPINGRVLLPRSRRTAIVVLTAKAKVTPFHTFL